MYSNIDYERQASIDVALILIIVKVDTVPEAEMDSGSDWFVELNEI